MSSPAAAQPSDGRCHNLVPDEAGELVRCSNPARQQWCRKCAPKVHKSQKTASRGTTRAIRGCTVARSKRLYTLSDTILRDWRDYPHPMGGRSGQLLARVDFPHTAEVSRERRELGLSHDIVRERLKKILVSSYDYGLVLFCEKIRRDLYVHLLCEIDYFDFDVETKWFAAKGLKDIYTCILSSGPLGQCHLDDDERHHLPSLRIPNYLMNVERTTKFFVSLAEVAGWSGDGLCQLICLSSLNDVEERFGWKLFQYFRRGKSSKRKPRLSVVPAWNYLLGMNSLLPIMRMLNRSKTLETYESENESWHRPKIQKFSTDEILWTLEELEDVGTVEAAVVTDQPGEHLKWSFTLEEVERRKEVPMTTEL